MNLHVLLLDSAWGGATKPMALSRLLRKEKAIYFSVFVSEYTNFRSGCIKVDSPSALTRRRDRRRQRRRDGALLPSTVYTWNFPSMRSRHVMTMTLIHDEGTISKPPIPTIHRGRNPTCPSSLRLRCRIRYRHRSRCVASSPSGMLHRARARYRRRRFLPISFPGATSPVRPTARLTPALPNRRRRTARIPPTRPPRPAT